jgi:hypothetical protein
MDGAEFDEGISVSTVESKHLFDITVGVTFIEQHDRCVQNDFIGLCNGSYRAPST